jgi:predicted acyltransferase
MDTQQRTFRGDREVPRHIYDDVSGQHWTVREVDTTTVPGARASRGLIFDSGSETASPPAAPRPRPGLRRIRRALLDWGRLGNHLWASSKTWDPEGVLSTIPAIGTAMLGVMAGRWIGTTRSLFERLAGLFAAGAIAMVLGAMWGWSFPINKSLWTSSYVLFTAGMAATALATAMWVIDAHGVRGWTKPFVVFGVNPIVAFVGSGMLARLIYSIVKVEYQGQRVALQTAIYKAGFASWLEPRNASLLFALTFVLLWFGILSALYRKRISLKV